MKSINFSSSRHCFFSAVLFSLALVSLLFVSCDKEKLVEVPVVTTVQDSIDRPNESEDLIAWYNPLNDAFLIDPQFVENVLITLQAQPTSNGGYSMQGVNLLGEPRFVHFKIELVNAPDIFIKAEAAEKPLTPDLISTFEEKGSSYRVYKNAECGKLQAGFESGCENGADGTSTKRTWYDIRKCERGNGLCTEAKGLIGKSVTYHNANCQGPIKEEKSLYGYACWQ